MKGVTFPFFYYRIVNPSSSGSLKLSYGRDQFEPAIYHYLDNLEEDKTVDARECYIRVGWVV